MNTFSSNLRLFFHGAWLSYVALFHWFRPVHYMASKILMPLAQMFFLVFLGTFATSADNASFYVIGNAIQITAVSGIFGVTMSVGGERETGTLPYLFGTPANRFVVFLSRVKVLCSGHAGCSTSCWPVCNPGAGSTGVSGSD